MKEMIIDLWNRWKYVFTGKKLVKSYTVTYHLKTASGDTLIDIEEYKKNSTPIPITDRYFDKLGYWKEYVESQTKTFNKRAEEILKEYRKNKIVTLDRGTCIQGKHFVKCDWRIESDADYPDTFEEYKKHILNCRRIKKNDSI